MSKQISEAQNEEVVEIATEETVERPYKLRKLMDADLFPLLQLLRKLGVKDIKNSITEARGKKAFDEQDYETEEERAVALRKMQEAAGIDLILDMADMLIMKIDTHSEDIYGFFSTLAGVPADEIKAMEFGTLPLMIYDAFSEVKNTAFFKVLTKLL